MARRVHVVVLAALAAFGGAGCESWKASHAGVGRALTAGVSGVTVEGKRLLRLRGRVSSALIDPDGGRIEDYHLAPPAKWFFVDDPDDPERKRVVVEDSSPVGVVSPAKWEVRFTPTNETLEHATYWQVDASVARVVLLSDKAGGLRCRKEFQLRRTGELEIAVSVQNVSGKAMQVDAGALMGVSGIVAGEKPADTHPAESSAATFESANPNEPWRLTRAWNAPSPLGIDSRTMGGTTGHTLTFTRPALAPGEVIEWRETWTLIRGR